MSLFLFFLVLKFCGGFGCMPTPTQEATPEVPVLPCATCTAPPLTDVPAETPPPTFIMGTGTVTAGAPVGPGCNTFIVSCDAADMNRFVVIGANMQFISLSTPSGGAKMATLVCNANGELEGRTVPAGDAVIVTSVYCSNARM